MSEKKEFVSIVPLANFDSDADLVQLNDNLCLRRVEDDELEKLIKLAPGYRFALENTLLDVKYVIEKRIAIDSKRESVSLWDWSEESPHVRNIVLALRLLKEGHVETPTAFLLSPTSSGVSNTTPHVRQAFSEYHLELEEISRLKELLRKLRNVETKKPHLRFPLTQFDRAFEETYPDEILVDFMTALESLVFHRGKTAPRPLGRTIGIAIGMLIGKNEEERAEIEKNLEAAYEMRNALVHGHLKLKKKFHGKSGTQIWFKASDYLRRALIRFIEE